MPPILDTPQSLCRFGIARCDITPPAGIYHRMWGAATHDRSTGIHRPLSATACVFRPWESTTESDDEQVLVAIRERVRVLLGGNRLPAGERLAGVAVS